MKKNFEIDLLIGGYSYTVTDNLKNWSDVKYTLDRSDYGGVITQFSTKFEFSNKAYSLLRNEYLSNYLSSSASIVLYRINNSRLKSERFRCSLDFSSLEDDGSTISINAIDNTLSSIIKSKKNTTYDILVSDVKSSKPLSYDPLNMRNESTWIMTGSTDDSGSESHITNTYEANSDVGVIFTIPIYIENSEIDIKNAVEVYDCSLVKDPSLVDKTLLKCIKPVTIHVSYNFNLYVRFIGDTANIPVYLTKHHNGTGLWVNGNQLLVAGNNNLTGEFDVSLQKGDCISFTLSVKKSAEIYQLSNNSDSLNVTFMAKGEIVDIDVISPISLLSSLIRNIYGNEVAVSIPLNNRLLNTMICAAESVRGINEAKIHTSYSKFCEFMEAEFGYVPVIGNNSISFVNRESLFSNEVIKSLSKNHSGFKFNVADSLIYSSVKVGYDKTDYDSVNGRDEFRFTNEYTTGVNLTDKSFSLISPYRADAYGIEFLVEKRGEDTTDDSSDNDVFIVDAIEDLENYYLNKSISISGVIDPTSMFNARFSPRYMIEANKKYIGAFSKKLIFSSSEGNSDVVIDGISEKDDFDITERLFRAETVTIDSDDQDVPSDFTKAIDIVKNGKIYRGYISSIDYMIAHPETITYNLIVQGIYEDS